MMFVLYLEENESGCEYLFVGFSPSVGDRYISGK